MEKGPYSKIAFRNMEIGLGNMESYGKGTIQQYRLEEYGDRFGEYGELWRTDLRAR